MKHSVPTLLLYLTTIISIQGQSSILNFHQLTPNEGLTQSTNEFLSMDRQGFVWIGSIAGVNRFDGIRVEAFLPDSQDTTSVRGFNTQSSFFEDAEGNIWFSTDQALNCYRKHQGNFTALTAYDSTGQKGGPHYAFHLEQDRYLWYAAAGQVFRVDTQDPALATPQLTLDSCYLARAIAETAPNGRVKAIYNCFWQNGDGFELINFRSDQSQQRSVWFQQEGQPAPYTLRAKQVIAISDGEVCFLTNQGLLFFQPEVPQNYYLLPFPRDYLRVTHMEKVGNELWLVNNSAQIAKVSLRAGNYEFQADYIRAFNFDEKEFIQGINRLFVTPDSTLWICVPDRGIYFANLRNNRSFSIYDQNELPRRSVQTVFENSNAHIWTVAQAGPENGQVFSFTPDYQLAATFAVPPYFNPVKTADDNIWAISLNGIGQQQAEEGSFDWNFYGIDSSTSLFDVVTYENGLIIGTDRGIYYFDPTLQRAQKIGAYNGFAFKIFLDNNKRLWFDDLSGDLKVADFEPKELSLNNIHVFPNMGLISDIYEDVGNEQLLIASPYGLFSFQEGPAGVVDTLLLTTGDIPNGYIKSIAYDRDGKLWLATNGGMVQLETLTAPSNTSLHYTSDDGLSANEYNPGSRLLTSTGDVLFGSTAGVDVMFEKKIARLPQAVLKHLYINNSAEEWLGPQGNTIIGQQLVEFRHQENTLSLEFAALEYTAPLRNRIKVFLASDTGVDSTVISAGEIMHYTQLEPGEYNLQYTASNTDGDWQPQLQQLGIIIHPPWWKTRWFMMLSTLVALAIIISVIVVYFQYQLKVKDLELAEERILSAERDRIAADMHEHINAELGHIRRRSIKIAQKENLDDLRAGLLEISRLSLFLVFEIKDLIWTLSPRKGILEELIIRITENINRFLEESDISKKISRPSQIPPIPLSSTARYNINYTAKELLNNILKYADASHIAVDFSIGDYFQLTIADNGSGFDFEAASDKGHGIHNCQKRIEALGGTINWQTHPSGGTIVNIRVKIEDLD